MNWSFKIQIDPVELLYVDHDRSTYLEEKKVTLALVLSYSRFYFQALPQPDHPYLKIG